MTEQQKQELIEEINKINSQNLGSFQFMATELQTQIKTLSDQVKVLNQSIQTITEHLEI